MLKNYDTIVRFRQYAWNNIFKKNLGQVGDHHGHPGARDSLANRGCQDQIRLDQMRSLKKPRPARTRAQAWGEDASLQRPGRFEESYRSKSLYPQAQEF